MNVVITTGSLFWAGHLAQALSRDGHACTLLTGSAPTRPAGAQVRCLPVMHLVERGLSAALPRRRGAIEYTAKVLFDRWAARQIGALSPDLVIGWSSFVTYTLTVAARRGAVTALQRGSTHIDLQHELLRDEFARWGVRHDPVDGRVRARETAEYATAHWITVPSTGARASFVDRGVPAEKLEVVPFGVDTSRFRPQPWRDAGFRVLFVGLIDLRKGVPYLLQAFDRVRGADSELTLVGSLSRSMQRLLQSLRVPYVHHATAWPDVVAALMARASVLVVPSIEEGLARVVLEGMASGTPVIASSASGAGDVITDGVDGFVVPPRDVDAIADRLRLLRDQPEHARTIGARARRTVENAYTWDDYCRRTSAIVQRRMAALRPAA